MQKYLHHIKNDYILIFMAVKLSKSHIIIFKIEHFTLK